MKWIWTVSQSFELFTLDYIELENFMFTTWSLRTHIPLHCMIGSQNSDDNLDRSELFLSLNFQGFHAPPPQRCIWCAVESSNFQDNLVDFSSKNDNGRNGKEIIIIPAENTHFFRFCCVHRFVLSFTSIWSFPLIL